MNTTDKEFSVFCQEVRRWIVRLGLSGYEIFFEHGGIDADILAQVAINYEARFAIFSLGKEWPSWREVTKAAVKRAAFHEVVHLLLAPLETGAATDRARVSAEHAIIERLSKALAVDE